jgi:hypothetical protein
MAVCFSRSRREKRPPNASRRMRVRWDGRPQNWIVREKKMNCVVGNHEHSIRETPFAYRSRTRWIVAENKHARNSMSMISRFIRNPKG